MSADDATRGIGDVIVVPAIFLIALLMLSSGTASAMPLYDVGEMSSAECLAPQLARPPGLGTVPVPLAAGETGPPIADAGPDQIVRAGDLVLFDGTGSFDEESAIESYQWMFYDNGWVFLDGPVPSYAFMSASTAPKEVTLMVTDSWGNVGYDTMKVTVWPDPVMLLKPSSFAMSGTRTWSYATPADGEWTLRIENHGLYSAVVYVVQRSGGAGARVFTATINFAALGAYPSGVVHTGVMPMTSGWYYQVTATPFGAVGRYAVLDIEYTGLNRAPVADVTISVDDMNVSVDASGSYDPDLEPIMLAWDWGDGSNKATGITATHTYSARGDYVVTLEVRDAAGLRDTIARNVTVPPGMDRIYVIYDMFQQPWGEWWSWRYPAYGTDIILNNTPGNYTMIYNPDKRGCQGIIYAPHRMSVTALNMTNLNAASPEFMPVMHEPVAGAEAAVDVYFEYLSWDWWNSYWSPYWGFPNTTMQGQTTDGYYLGVVINATMDREAAEMWLGLPTNASVAEWWAANADAYTNAWSDWIDYEGNVRLDIWAGYEWPYVTLQLGMKLSELGDGRVLLEIGTVSWGYEVLMTRWLTEATVVDHEPYWEDFTLHAEYDDIGAWVALDGVCQYSMHAVKQNASVYDPAHPETPLPGAWVWEPLKIDYVPSWATSGGSHPSRYDPWDAELGIYYQSWNAGDPSFTYYVVYEAAPSWFNLSKTEMLVIQLPRHDQVIGYLANKAPMDAIANIVSRGNYSYYDSITVHGGMELGFYITNYSGGGADLASMYDPVAKRLEIRGPYDFDNWRWPNGAIYHGAPWIEFNIVP